MLGAAGLAAQGQSGAEIPKRPLGRTGLEVSALGIGGYHLGSVDSDAEAIQIVDEALDAGVNFFDNAWEYHQGLSEERLGRALKGKRDRAILAILLGCGLRRRELADLEFTHIQQREDHWAIVDLVGKGGHIRTVPMPGWVKAAVDLWVAAAGISAGRLFRCVCRAGKHWGDGVTERVVWHVVKQYAKTLGFARLAPHDLRRSCAKLCHSAGGELEQIQFLLGHVSVQTTERYLGCKQRIQGAVNDHLGIEP